MRAEIICIGTELLLGHIINTNASFIAQRLAEIGIDHYFDITVGDNPARLKEAVRTAMARSDIVITTGGLGPTVDDITTQTIAELLKRQLILEKSVVKDMTEYFKKLKRDIPKDSLRQGLIPECSKPVKNPFGTAPGIIIGHDGKIIICLPGPPREMEPMVVNHIIPYLKKRVRVQGTGYGVQDETWIIKSRSVKLIGIAEASVNEKVKDLLNLSGAITVGIYARPREVELKIMAKQKNEKLADVEIAKIEKVIRKRLKEYIYGTDDETLEEIAGKLLLRKKSTLAVAESCTGGLLSNLITNVPGSSEYFKEGIVTYSNESKIKYLGVPAEYIRKYGAVSPQVAQKMAQGIKDAAGVDAGLGITGIAGPGGATRKKPVGLVYIAIATKNKSICREFHFLGSRTEIKMLAAKAALDMIRVYV